RRLFGFPTLADFVAAFGREIGGSAAEFVLKDGYWTLLLDRPLSVDGKRLRIEEKVASREKQRGDSYVVSVEGNNSERQFLKLPTLPDLPSQSIRHLIKRVRAAFDREQTSLFRLHQVSGVARYLGRAEATLIDRDGLPH